MMKHNNYLSSFVIRNLKQTWKSVIQWGKLSVRPGSENSVSDSLDLSNIPVAISRFPVVVVAHAYSADQEEMEP
jgi:hypothetical protein